MTKREQQLAKLLRETIDSWREFNGLMHREAANENRTPESQLELRMASVRFQAAMGVGDEFLRTGKTPPKSKNVH